MAHLMDHRLGYFFVWYSLSKQAPFRFLPLDQIGTYRSIQSTHISWSNFPAGCGRRAGQSPLFDGYNHIKLALSNRGFARQNAFKVRGRTKHHHLLLLFLTTCLYHLFCCLERSFGSQPAESSCVPYDDGS